MVESNTAGSSGVAAKPGDDGRYRKRRRIFLRTVFSLALLAALALVFAKDVLCIDSGAQTGEVIIVLGGGVFDRPPRAAELFKAGVASRIIVTGNGDCDDNRRALVLKGVPEGAIELECRSRTTRENAQFTLPLLQASGVKRVILVTSWYHSRRALNTFRNVAPGIQFVSVPSYHTIGIFGSYPFTAVCKEYAKSAWYFVRWGIPPWQQNP